MLIYLLKALVLGIVQGLTEFLPVSSSGHLVIGQHFIGFESPGITFEVMVHFGTLLAVIVVFRERIWHLIAAFLRAVRLAFQPKKLVEFYKISSDLRLCAAIIIGTIPAALVGLFLEEKIEGLFGTPALAALMIVFTGVFLMITRVKAGGEHEPGLFQAILVGVAQAVAIVPGISRSGATISTGLFLGLKRDKAGEFSFLLSIPAILGATILKIPDLTRSGDWLLSLGGGLAAFVVGWISLRFLLGVIRRGRLYLFSYYCFIIGIVSLIFFYVTGNT